MPRGSRRERRTTLALIAIAALGFAVAPAGRAPATAAESTEFSQKIVLQNDRVRAQMNYYPPGTSAPEHEHKSARVVVVVEGGTLEIRDVSGKVSTLSLKNGDIVWRPPEKHSITNSGSTPVRLVEIDVLDCPKK
jgi:quercetin dioxygenase-like cupin family protein